MKFIILSLILLLGSCKKEFQWDAFKKCIESAPSVMDYPFEMESLGKFHHAIGGYQQRDRKSYTWGTYVSFGSRYSIELSIEVMLNKDHTKIVKVLSEPEFHLLIHKTISKNKGGGLGARFEDDIKFGAVEWNEMIKVKGDIGKMLAVLNVKENKDPLPLFEEFSELGRPAPHHIIKLSKETPKGVKNKIDQF